MPDWLYGGRGNDVIIGNGEYTDIMYGNEGNDLLIDSGILGDLYGGKGRDTCVYDNIDSVSVIHNCEKRLTASEYYDDS